MAEASMSFDTSTVRPFLERFALVEVPAGSAPEAVSVRGREVALEPIRN